MNVEVDVIFKSLLVVALWELICEKIKRNYFVLQLRWQLPLLRYPLPIKTKTILRLMKLRMERMYIVMIG